MLSQAVVKLLLQYRVDVRMRTQDNHNDGLLYAVSRVRSLSPNHRCHPPVTHLHEDWAHPCHIFTWTVIPHPHNHARMNLPQARSHAGYPIGFALRGAVPRVMHSTQCHMARDGTGPDARNPRCIFA